jgi:hypothetical protein
MMKRAVILRRPLSDRMRPDLRPANDNDPPEPPPAASQRQRRLAPLMAAIAALGTNRLVHAAQAA